MYDRYVFYGSSSSLYLMNWYERNMGKSDGLFLGGKQKVEIEVNELKDLKKQLFASPLWQ